MTAAEWEAALIEGQLLGPRYSHIFHFEKTYAFVARVADYDYYMARVGDVFQAYGLIRSEASYYYYPLHSFEMPHAHRILYESLIKHLKSN